MAPSHLKKKKKKAHNTSMHTPCAQTHQQAEMLVCIQLKKILKKILRHTSLQRKKGVWWGDDLFFSFSSKDSE
jgi:hypothetical protein